MAAKIIRRPAQKVDWQKVLDILYEQGIIYANYSGRLTIEFNRGGVSACDVSDKLK